VVAETVAVGRAVKGWAAVTAAAEGMGVAATMVAVTAAAVPVVATAVGRWR
jgi:hypothetical protein